MRLKKYRLHHTNFNVINLNENWKFLLVLADLIKWKTDMWTDVKKKRAVLTKKIAHKLPKMQAIG